MDPKAWACRMLHEQDFWDDYAVIGEVVETTLLDLNAWESFW